MDGLGSKLRNARVANGLTMAEVAQRSELSVSYVSEVERDQANPSIGAVNRIAEAIGIRMSCLFEDTETEAANSYSEMNWFSGPELTSTAPPVLENDARLLPRVVRHDRRKRFIYPGSGVVNELLCPDLQHAIEIQQVEAPIGTESGDETIAHHGEECILVTEGQMKVTIGDQEFVLNEGDTVYFSGLDPHAWENTGDTPLKAIFVITPPHF
jgi:transcriptional regulator with XRE-family HTH domain